MRRRVWMDSWQLQCCGEPFGIGDSVEWTVTDPSTSREFISSVLGRDEAERITDCEERHCADGALPTIWGRVAEIQAVFCRYGPAAGETAQVLVPGSAVLEQRFRAEGEANRTDLSFVAYLIGLDSS